MRFLTLRAHAKINLYLKIGSKRTDGYHSLHTLFQGISLHDTLRFRRTKNPAIRLTVSGQRLSSGPDNLVVRALHLLRNRLGTKEGMDIHLTKKIPMGAGLGGGSSDAAVALWAGWLLWRKAKRTSYRKKCPALLFDLARRLGADVPFFLMGGRAEAKGIGEKLSIRKSGAKQWMVLVYPRVHVATALAYRMLDRSKRNRIKVSPNKFFNSFEPVVFKKFPRVAQVATALKTAGCHPVLMSGSGSSVFGFVRNKKSAQRIRKSLEHRPWDAYVVHT